MTRPTLPIDVVHLLPVLDKILIELLESLTKEEWQKQTVARLWTVKDVAGHLLDGNIRILSMLRDDYFGEKTTAQTFGELVDFLNGLNADWVKAMKRVSPGMLILLHKATGKLYCDYYASLDPLAKSGFPVDWAGEKESKNWLHIAREYTEKWLHQQQIREAVNKPALMTEEFFYPFIDTFMYALPYTYRNIKAKQGTVVQLTISSEIGGSWCIHADNGGWQLAKEKQEVPASEIIIDPDTSWKLFSKSLRPEQVKDKIIIHGDRQLGETALNMISVMA